MAEEPRQVKTYIQKPRKNHRGLTFFAAFQIGLFGLFFGTSSAFPNGSAATVSTIDLSVPLWGGAVTADTSFNLSDTAAASEIKLHHFGQLACGSCHEPPADAGVTADIKNSGWSNGVDVNRSCTSFGCHDYDQKMNHPLDVPLPAGVVNPSSSDHTSVVTCLSCHQPKESNNSGSAQEQTDRFLQSPEAVGCQSCHSKISGSMKQQSHWKFSQKAHLVTLTPGLADETASHDLMDYGAAGIDAESNACLSCHDNITVTIPALDESQQEKAERFRNMADHPIGMNYTAVLSRNPMYFKSLMGKEDRVRMFDGNVGCGTCHSLYSDIPFNLTEENEESGLCRTCHNR